MQTTISLPIENLLPKEGCVTLYEDVIDANFEDLCTSTQWKQEPITLFGREVMQPRLTAWYGDKGTEYRYSGLMNYPLSWTEALLEIKRQVEKISDCTFNSVLLNRYRHGQDSMGWHQDNEMELGDKPTIASVSLGAGRQFQMQHKFDKSLRRLNFELEHGSLLIMSGDTQRYWQHQVPKTKKDIGQRINLTFRTIIRPL